MPAVPDEYWACGRIGKQAGYLSFEQPPYQIVAEGPKAKEGKQLLEFCCFPPGWNADRDIGNYIVPSDLDMSDPFCIARPHTDATSQKDWRLSSNGNLIAFLPANVLKKYKTPFRDTSTGNVNPYDSRIVDRIDLRLPNTDHITDELNLVGGDVGMGGKTNSGAYVQRYNRNLKNV